MLRITQHKPTSINYKGKRLKHDPRMGKIFLPQRRDQNGLSIRNVVQRLAS